MSAELVERRVLGAVRFVDAVTGLTIDTPLSVSADGVRWIRNRRGYWVLATAPGLAAFEDLFAAQPAAPAVGSIVVSITVSDATGRWLARRASIALPRDADPEHESEASSLFIVQDVPLFPAPAAPTQRSWAIVRASVRGASPNEVLGGALVRVVRDSDGKRIGAGMSDARGEALIAVEGIPSSSLGEEEGPVVASEISARLEVVWDQSAGNVPDLDALEANHAALLVRQTSVKLAAGRVLTRTL